MDGFVEQGYECEVVCLSPRSNAYSALEPQIVSQAAAVDYAADLRHYLKNQ